MERPVSQLLPYQTKYPCIICTERVRVPVSCLRCRSLICLAHVRRIDDRCPYCRLAPFAYERERFMEELVDFDRRREEERMIQTATFQCLVEGCDFRGKYHKMDLHRRKMHREWTLRQIIFPQAMENGRRLRAVEMLVTRIRERNQQQNRAFHLGLILHNRARGRVTLPRLAEMIAHVDACGHPHCRKVHVEAVGCFIGTNGKEMSECPEAQRFLIFFQAE